MRPKVGAPVMTVCSERGGGFRDHRRPQSSHGGGCMTANHRAGRRAANEDPVSGPAGHRVDVVDWRVSVPGVPVMVAVARQLVRAALEHSPRVRDVELIISELVTNAISHTPSGEVGSLVTLRIRA